MPIFLILWGLMFGSLVITLGALSVVYRMFEADLGLHGFVRETVIAVVTSVLQAGAMWCGHAVTGSLVGETMMVAAIVLVVCYEATHLHTERLEGIYAMDHWAVGAVAFTQYGLLVCSGYVLSGLYGG